MQLRWGDTDAMGHVNNTLYFRYFEECRMQLSAAVGLDDSSGRFGVLAHASCDFIEPLMYPACIVVQLGCLRLGRSSLELECTILDAANRQRVHARGRSVIVCADRQTGRPLPWSQAERQALAGCFAA